MFFTFICTKNIPFSIIEELNQEGDASYFAIFMKGQALTAKLKVDCAIRVRRIQTTAKKLGPHILLFSSHSNICTWMRSSRVWMRSSRNCG
jgi:hypothetical protein